MSEKKLEIGDKVKLKTGEAELPIMVINEWFNSERAICKWFDTKANEYKKDGFHVNTLVKVED
jgi:uncharacterized protein YodC (DUF2158 family)